MKRHHAFTFSAAGIASGLVLIAVAHLLPGAGATPGAAQAGKASHHRVKDREGFLDFALTPRRPGNLLMREDTVGRSAQGRRIELRQYGDPALEGELLVFGNLNPDGRALGTRLNGRGVDLNRNFPAGWTPIGSRGVGEN